MTETLIRPGVADIFSSREISLGEAMLEMAQEWMPLIDTHEASRAHQVLGADMGNIEEYFHWFNETETDAATDRIATDLYLAIGRFLDLQGLWMQRQHWGWMLYAIGDEDVYESDVRILNAIAVAYQELGYTEKCLGLYKLVTEIAEAQELEPEIIAQAYNNYATALWHADQLDDALIYAKKAFDLAIDAHYVQTVMSAMVTEACVRGNKGDFEAALAIFQRVKQIAVDQGDIARQAEIAVQLGFLHFEQGVLEEAGPYLKEAVDLYKLLGDEVGVLDTQLVVALWHATQGELEQASELTEASVHEMEHYPPEVFAQIAEWFDQIATEREAQDAADEGLDQNG